MKKNRPVDKLYKTIDNAHKKITAIRAKCKHKKTRMGLYSWRIGAVDNAELCNTCDALIPNMNTVFQPVAEGSKNIFITKDSTTSIGGNSNVGL